MNLVPLEQAFPTHFLNSAFYPEPNQQYNNCSVITDHIKSCQHCQNKLKLIIDESIANQADPHPKKQLAVVPRNTRFTNVLFAKTENIILIILIVVLLLCCCLSFLQQSSVNVKRPTIEYDPVQYGSFKYGSRLAQPMSPPSVI